MGSLRIVQRNAKGCENRSDAVVMCCQGAEFDYLPTVQVTGERSKGVVRHITPDDEFVDRAQQCPLPFGQPGLLHEQVTRSFTRPEWPVW